MLPAYKLRKGVLHIGLPVVILAVSFAIIFGFLKQGERTTATVTPIGSLSASSSTVNLDSGNPSVTFTASGLQGLNGTEVKEIRFYAVNPKLADGTSWRSPDACTVGYPPCESNSDDADGDGFNDIAEYHMGTDPNAACSSDASHDAWPPDTNNDRIVDLPNDLLTIIQNSGSSNIRYDLNVDGKVDEADYWVARESFQVECSLDTTGVLENDEIYNIRYGKSPGGSYEFTWDSSTQLASVGYDRFLTKNDLQPGIYTVGLRVEDEAGNINTGAAFITLELGLFGVPVASPSPSGLDIIDEDPTPPPVPSPSPSPIPSPSPLPIPDDLVGPLPTTYQYWVHVWGEYDDDGIFAYIPSSQRDRLNNPLLSTSESVGFTLTTNPDPRGYELLVCSPNCLGGFDSVTYKGPIVFYPHEINGSVNVTPNGPETILGIDSDNDGYTDEQEIFITGTDPLDACSFAPDINGDGTVDLANDLLTFLLNFSTNDNSNDINADGSVNVLDFLAMIGHVGETCGS